MKSIFIMLGLLAVCTITACNEEEMPEAELIPLTVKTRSPQSLANGGVVLSGILSTSKFLQEYGFVYARDSAQNIYANRIRLTEVMSSQEFSVQMVGDLEPGQKYLVKAYALSLLDTAEGEWLPFQVDINPTPVITEVQPTRGYPGDTIRLVGKHFGILQDAAKRVTIDQKRATILHMSDTAISCIVPKELSTVAPLIEVTIQENLVSANNLFTLQKPEIHTVSPSQGTFRDIIEIKGNHFDLTAENNQVFFGDSPAIVSSSSRDRLVVIVPDQLDSSEVQITLKSLIQETEAPGKFSLLAPIIDELPAMTKSREVITIKGRNFHPVYYQNKVFIDGNLAEIQSGYSNQLVVNVPDGPYPSSEASVHVEIAGLQSDDATPVGIEDAWRMIDDNLPFYFYRLASSFVVNNQAFVIAQPSGREDLKLWEFMQETQTWQMHHLDMDSVRGGNCTGDGTNTYMYRPTSTGNFFRFNVQQKQWIALKDFPGERRHNPAMFMIDGEVYVGLGGITTNYYNSYISKTFSDFYRYNPDNNTWERIEDLNGINNIHQYRARVMPPTFIIDGVAYLGGGMSSTDGRNWWKYDPGIGVWERLSDFHQNTDHASTFVLNGKGYMISGQSWSSDCWEYDPGIDSWRQVPSVGHTSRNGGFAFVVNGIPYAGGGGEDTYEHFFQLNTKKLE